MHTDIPAAAAAAVQQQSSSSSRAAAAEPQAPGPHERSQEPTPHDRRLTVSDLNGQEGKPVGRLESLESLGVGDFSGEEEQTGQEPRACSQRNTRHSSQEPGADEVTVWGGGEGRTGLGEEEDSREALLYGRPL